MEALPFEVEHHIDDVFEHARAGNRPFFGDVPDDDNGDVEIFGDPQQPQGAFTYLADRSCRRAQFFDVDGLDGVDNHQARALAVDITNRCFEICFRRNPQALGIEPHAVGA